MQEAVHEVRREVGRKQAAMRTKLKKAEGWSSQFAVIFFCVALILQQKGCFSLNDSHSFNRANVAYTQR
jgi:hypothetical protein